MGWLIALAILILLAIIPLGVTARYNADGFILDLLIGPFRKGILPGKEKDSKEKKKEKKSEQKKTGGKSGAPAHEEEKKGGPITDFIPIVQTVLAFLNDFRKKIRIKRLDVKLIMAGDDPCDLAVNYGRANAALGNLWPQLERCFVIKKRDVEIECDFEASETVITARADVTISFGWLLVLVVRYGVRALKQYLAIRNKRKGGKTK